MSEEHVKHAGGRNPLPESQVKKVVSIRLTPELIAFGKAMGGGELTGYIESLMVAHKRFLEALPVQPAFQTPEEPRPHD